MKKSILFLSQLMFASTFCMDGNEPAKLQLLDLPNEMLRKIIKRVGTVGISNLLTVDKRISKVTYHFLNEPKQLKKSVDDIIQSKNNLAHSELLPISNAKSEVLERICSRLPKDDLTALIKHLENIDREKLTTKQSINWGIILDCALRKCIL